MAVSLGTRLRVEGVTGHGDDRHLHHESGDTLAGMAEPLGPATEHGASLAVHLSSPRHGAAPAHRDRQGPRRGRPVTKAGPYFQKVYLVKVFLDP